MGTPASASEIFGYNGISVKKQYFFHHLYALRSCVIWTFLYSYESSMQKVRRSGKFAQNQEHFEKSPESKFHPPPFFRFCRGVKFFQWILTFEDKSFDSGCKQLLPLSSLSLEGDVDLCIEQIISKDTTLDNCYHKVQGQLECGALKNQ